MPKYRKRTGKSKRKRYSSAEKRAYWVGVGISLGRFGDSAVVLDNSNLKIQKSARNGYTADNHGDIGRKFFT